MHPDHINSSLSRADVNGSVLEARKNGTLAILQRGGVLPSKAVSPSKTREQVGNLVGSSFGPIAGILLIGGGLALLSLFGWLASRRSGAGG